MAHLPFTISRKRKAGPGDPAAHRTDRLPLLPSGSGGVHRVLSHRARPLSFVLGLSGLFSLSGAWSATKSIREPGKLNKLDWRRRRASVSYECSCPLRFTPKVFMWRRGWDSNPRSHCWDACFPSMSIRPLSHLSTPIFARPHLNMRSDDRQGEGMAS
jgi:hypothetical protein